MSIKFILMVNKQGQTRLAKYFEFMSMADKNTIESEIIRKCLSRGLHQCSLLEHRGYKCIYRRYASLFFIVGTDTDSSCENSVMHSNELSILELIHNLVETLDQYFGNVCELDIMFNLEKAHFIVDEMVINGRIVETNKTRILGPIRLYDQETEGSGKGKGGSFGW